MAGFFDAEDALDPGDDLVGGRVGGLVEIEDAVLEVIGEGALQRGVTGRDWGVVSGSYVEAVVVLEEDRPLGGVEGWGEALGFDHEVGGVFLSWLGAVGIGMLVLLLLLLVGERWVELRHGCGGFGGYGRKKWGIRVLVWRRVEGE